MLKICIKCKEEYPASIGYFYADKQHKDGLHSWCRKCHNQCMKKYRRTEKGKQIGSRSSRKYYSTIRGHLRRMFVGMKQRCTNQKNKRYKDYGGRGIKNKFKSSDKFLDYVINELRVDPRGLQIDRIDNDGNYEPGNIRFVTAKENSNNRREPACQKK